MTLAPRMRSLDVSDAAAIPVVDWPSVAYHTLLSRHLDDLEENRLVKQKQVLYQFSARGHDMAQAILGSLINRPGDAACGYYRSRPFMLSVGLELDEAMAAPLMRSGGMSDGRDIGVVFNMPAGNGPCVLPMSGGVGTQYTPVIGWAQAIGYRSKVLGEPQADGCMAVALGGDASTATNGFWSALNIATTQKLPVLFYIEDNGYGISVPSSFQTPGGNIAANLASFHGLHIFDGSGSDPREAASLLLQATNMVRAGKGPVLIRLRVPRLNGHSGQDTQAYKSAAQIDAEWERDPLPRLKDFMVPALLSEEQWMELDQRARDDLDQALGRVLERDDPDPATARRFVFSEVDTMGNPILQDQGGLWSLGHEFPPSADTPQPEPGRMNMATAIRRTLDCELASNSRLVVFGEDVGPKGGVHAVTLGLQDKYGEDRVFDTSLSEEGIIGRAVGLAAAGLMPVAEIQFRKYADPAEEQLNDCGTMRWRTNNRFAAPMVVRIPGGYFKCGDPWHSQCGEVKWAHAVGWRVAMPSNAEDAVGLLRTAMRDNNPTIFFEHRSLLDDVSARRPYPGDQYVLPFGKGRRVRDGGALSVISWGAMVARCEQAIAASGVDAELIDLRTLVPWDKEQVLESVSRTRRCLIVHEDTLTAGFGAEIAAVLSDEAFFDLDAPVKRLTMPDMPSPHSPVLLNAVVPGVNQIADALRELDGV
jgi:2-oxoisovalerate dehydrogenase E1 component